jgi:chromate transporter
VLHSSALILVLFAFGAAVFGGPVGSGVIHGLKIVAVAVVAQAVWGMARALCPDPERASIAVAAVLFVILAAGSVGQIGAIVMGGLAGLWLCRSDPVTPVGHLTFPVSKKVGRAQLCSNWSGRRNTNPQLAKFSCNID